MNAKKIEILPHLYKSEYVLTSHCTELERMNFDKLSYQEIRDLVYKNQQRLLAMTKEEQDAVNNSNALEQDIIEFMNSPIKNQNSYRKQLFDTYESLYWLDEIIDYYKSLDVTPERIKELNSTYKDDTLIYEYLRHPGINPFARNYRDYIYKHIMQAKISIFDISAMDFDSFINDKDDIDCLISDRLQIQEDEYLAIKYVTFEKLTHKQNEFLKKRLKRSRKEFYKAKAEVFRELKIKTIIENLNDSQDVFLKNAYELKDKKYSDYQLKVATYIYDHKDEVFPPDDTPRTFNDIFQSILSK